LEEEEEKEEEEEEEEKKPWTKTIFLPSLNGRHNDSSMYLSTELLTTL